MPCAPPFSRSRSGVRWPSRSPPSGRRSPAARISPTSTTSSSPLPPASSIRTPSSRRSRRSRSRTSCGRPRRRRTTVVSAASRPSPPATSSSTATTVSRRPLPPYAPRNFYGVRRRIASRRFRAEVKEHRLAAGVVGALAAWVAAHAATAVAHRVRDKFGNEPPDPPSASPQPGESAIEGSDGWVLSGPMATKDATQSGDGAQKGDNGEGGQSPEDVVGLKEIGFGEVKHGLPDKDTCLTVLQKMLLIRRFEERAGEMYAKAKVGGFLHLCIGEEATIVGATQALRDNDYLMSTYREHGQAIARGTHPNEVMAELFGREGGCSKGRGGSMHLFDMERRFLGGYGIVGGSLPLSAGVALACDYMETDDVILSMMGDGATNQGTFGETMNLAALWKLPVVFVIINNQFGMGTALHRHSAVTDLSLKAEGYGVPGTRCDGMDVLDVHDVVTSALKCARE